jgi:hypothetical protein
VTGLLTSTSLRITFERSCRMLPIEPRDRFGEPAKRTQPSTIKTMPPRRGSATSEFLGRPNLGAAHRRPTAIQSHWIGPRPGNGPTLPSHR